MADIFFDGKIYLGVKEKLLTSFKKPVRDIWIEQYPVSGQHSFKDGQEVTGLYELKYEQWCNNVATLNGKHTLVTEIKDASIIVGKCPDCYVKTFAIPSSPTKEAEADVLRKEAETVASTQGLEFHTMQEHPIGVVGEEFSVTVLIFDENDNEFCDLGYYDFESKQWSIFGDMSFKMICWCYLPNPKEFLKDKDFKSEKHKGYC